MLNLEAFQIRRSSEELSYSWRSTPALIFAYFGFHVILSWGTVRVKRGIIVPAVPENLKGVALFPSLDSWDVLGELRLCAQMAPISWAKFLLPVSKEI